MLQNVLTLQRKLLKKIFKVNTVWAEKRVCSGGRGLVLDFY